MPFNALRGFLELFWDQIIFHLAELTCLPVSHTSLYQQKKIIHHFNDIVACFLKSWDEEINEGGFLDEKGIQRFFNSVIIYRFNLFSQLYYTCREFFMTFI